MVQQQDRDLRAAVFLPSRRLNPHFSVQNRTETVQKPYKPVQIPYTRNAPAGRRQMLPAGIRLAVRRHTVRLPRRQSGWRFLLPARQETRFRLAESGQSQARIDLRGRRATVPKSARFRAKIGQMSSGSRQKHPRSARKNTHKRPYIPVDTVNPSKHPVSVSQVGVNSSKNRTVCHGTTRSTIRLLTLVNRWSAPVVTLVNS